MALTNADVFQPSTGGVDRIACWFMKVINHLGDEIVKVLRVKEVLE